MAATIQSVARRARVSETTVSLAFQPGSRISDATRRRVLAAADRLKYVPNVAARQLRHGRTSTLGMLVLDLTNPFYAQMVRSVEVTAREHGYQVIAAESRWLAEEEVRSLEKMIQARVEGLLACFTEETDESLRLLKRYAVPYVALDTYPAGFKGAYVANDLVAAGRLAATHLVGAGYRRPVLVTAGEQRRHFSAFKRLRRGFAGGLQAHDIPLNAADVFAADLTIAAGNRAFAEIRRDRPDADAVFCGNDLCALGLMDAADRAGLRVGADIGIMGIDDLDASGLTRTSLTSIRQPSGALAEEAARCLIDAIRRGQPPSIRKSYLPTLIPRNSTRRRSVTHR